MSFLPPRDVCLCSKRSPPALHLFLSISSMTEQSLISGEERSKGKRKEEEEEESTYVGIFMSCSSSSSSSPMKRGPLGGILTGGNKEGKRGEGKGKMKEKYVEKTRREKAETFFFPYLHHVKSCLESNEARRGRNICIKPGTFFFFPSLFRTIRFARQTRRG